MADAGQFAKDADILLRVGTNGATAVKAAGFFDTIIIDVEAIINVASRFDWAKQDRALLIISILRDKKAQEFMKNA